jgi:hypothetical protein
VISTIIELCISYVRAVTTFAIANLVRPSTVGCDMSFVEAVLGLIYHFSPDLDTEHGRLAVNRSVIIGLIDSECTDAMITEVLRERAVDNVMAVIGDAIAHNRVDIVRMLIANDSDTHAIDINEAASDAASLDDANMLMMLVDVYGANNYTEIIASVIHHNVSVISYIDGVARRNGNPVDYDAILDGEYGNLNRQLYGRLLAAGYISYDDISRSIYRAASHGNATIVGIMRRALPAGATTNVAHDIYDKAIRMAIDEGNDDARRLLVEGRDR